jgi:hypothetical protein
MAFFNQQDWIANPLTSNVDGAGYSILNLSSLSLTSQNSAANLTTLGNALYVNGSPVGGGQASTLQQVCTNGNTTTTPVIIAGVKLTGANGNILTFTDALGNAATLQVSGAIQVNGVQLSSDTSTLSIAGPVQQTINAVSEPLFSQSVYPGVRGQPGKAYLTGPWTQGAWSQLYTSLIANPGQTPILFSSVADTPFNLMSIPNQVDDLAYMFFIDPTSEPIIFQINPSGDGWRAGGGETVRFVYSLLSNSWRFYGS